MNMMGRVVPALNLRIPTACVGIEGTG